MAHHAFFYEGDLEQGIAATALYAEEELKIPAHGNPDVITIRYGLFSVDDARKLTELAYQNPVNGSHKVIALAAGRIFHEAQNALLKLFEETPEGTTLILIIPSKGILLETLQSRLLPLPGDHNRTISSEEIETFLKSTPDEQAKVIAKIVDRSKSERPEADKQAARLEALTLAENIERAAYAQRLAGNRSKELMVFLDDLAHFIPLLHDRSAPIKLIYE
ncbi:hypothetical protein KKH15_00490, partial [Patescibacteria group bacterium]|nr:hypothetical protein [Patescibacteria group bacterium]MBU1754716.1 hypothetical protein [Patescibacteria group bacterium]